MTFDPERFRKAFAEEQEIVAAAGTQGLYFDGQDNLSSLVCVAQDEIEQGHLEAAHGVLTYVLSRHPNHRVALINEQIAQAYMYIDTVPFEPKRSTYKNLTIGLCLFNRPKEARQNLSVLIHQISRLPEEIEIVIGDNGDNFEAIADLVQRSDNIQYKKRPFNLGLDLNLLNVFHDAIGDYVYIIGDDDILFDRAVERIIDAIEDKAHDNISLFYFVPYIMDPLLRRLDRGNYEYTISPHETYTILTRDESIKTIGVGMLRLSSLVYRRHAIDEDALKYLVGYLLFPLIVSLSALTLGSLCAINKPLYAYRQQISTSWATSAHKIFYNYQPAAFYAMYKAGKASYESVSGVFDHLQIDIRRWASLFDPDVIAKTNDIVLRLDHSVKGVDKFLAHHSVVRKSCLDLVEDFDTFDTHMIGMKDPACFRVEKTFIMIHASAFGEATQKLVVSGILLGGRDKMSIGASIPISCVGPVMLFFHFMSTGGESKRQNFIRVNPGEKKSELFALEGLEGVANLEVWASMSEGTQGCDYASVHIDTMYIGNA